MDSSKKRFEAAVKVQKAFRGFRVRKTVKKILELKREVDGVEKKLREKETMAVIKRDAMERLKVNENLMALLFKLDSVRGFNDEVRDFRKQVIRKVIMLQELIDSAIDYSDDVRAVEERDSEEISGDNDVKEDGGIEEREKLGFAGENADGLSVMYGDNVENVGEEKESANNFKDFVFETLELSDKFNEDADNAVESLDDSSKMQVEKFEESVAEGAEVANVMQVKTAAGSDHTWECVGAETEEQKSDCFETGEEDNHGGVENREGRTRGLSPDDWCVVGGGREEKEKKEKLLEKMAEDNQRLMAMVADLCQKNTVQTRMICSLSQRVENLEKAMSDRLRKKKKKCNAVHN